MVQARQGPVPDFLPAGCRPPGVSTYFVAETADTIYMLEPKAGNQLDDPVVLAKKEVAVGWCRNASEHAKSYGGKPWRYVLMPHDAVAENMSLDGLAARYGGK